MPSHIPSQVPSHMLSHMPSQMLSQIPSQIPSQITSQMPSQIPLQSLQLPIPYLSNTPLQILPNILLYTMSNIPPQLLPNIPSQPYFIPYSNFPNFQPLPLYTLISQQSSISSKPVSQLDEFLTKIDEAENVNREILACLLNFQDQAIQVKQICKLTDEKFELVEITKEGWKIALQEASKEYNQ
ncbi:9627_t:CDS:2 [Racocetra fulgida]|uniref:9627_t:CDS:1 n=1 Tax=Racocetra fulgida TaxID=60492 RepID=A0A9N9AKS0_9GLOM|nr:9627_t:CDS:2 [Racocetra fulgida]